MVSFAQSFKDAIGLRLLPLIWVTLSVFGIFSDGIDASHMPISERVVLWPSVAGGGIVIGTLLRVFVRDILKLRRYEFETPVVAILCLLFLTPVCKAIAYLATRSWQGVPHWGNLAIYIVVVSVTVSTLRHALANTLPFPQQLEGEDGGIELPPDMDATPAEDAPRLLARLSPALRAPLVRVQVRNHYVDVVTEAGSARVLLRFADAIAETGEIEGLQVHRSHWVAKSALRGIRRSGGKVMVETSDGALVPVSRPYLGIVALIDLPELDAADGTETTAPQERSPLEVE